ncbi:heat shock protein beta-11-like [Uloborus diversus]|uniref:heat shock protein beta-11-like n=1 Tax=Uloborus diversus TaxID=327109 RepID=UPI00240A0570|nr:heat shock protein beta-11-like [Uloborus diversus]
MSNIALISAPFLRNCVRNLRNFERWQVCPIRGYWRRRDSLSEISSAFQTMEKYMREMDKEMNRVFNDIQRVSPVRIPRMFSPFGSDSEKELPIISTDKDSRVYKLELEMQGMKPEDIKLTVKHNELTVRARCEEERSDGSRYVKENSYHYTLPKEVNPDSIRCSLTDGVLTIEAPLPALESKEIPVTIESDEQKNSSDNTTKN